MDKPSVFFPIRVNPLCPALKIATAKGAKSRKEKHSFARLACFAVEKFSSFAVNSVHVTR